MFSHMYHWSWWFLFTVNTTSAGYQQLLQSWGQWRVWAFSIVGVFIK